MPGDGRASDGCLVSPAYRDSSPVEDLMRKVDPEQDIFASEVTAGEIEARLAELGALLSTSPLRGRDIESFLLSEFRGESLRPLREETASSAGPVEVFRARFSGTPALDRAGFAAEWAADLASFDEILTAEFRVVAIEAADEAAATTVRYDLVGTTDKAWRIQRTGRWAMDWKKTGDGTWRVVAWHPLEETRSRAVRPAFVEVTGHSLAATDSFKRQFLPGVDEWRDALDGALGIDVFGNNGLTVGDVDGDGFDDFYVCQPSGLPNRLFRNRGDGTFEDVTDAAGVGVLDSSSMALFVDVDHDGDQDLIVVTWKTPLLFLNDGRGKFRHAPDAFRFTEAPRGAFTAACVADYDRDGFVDLYLCSYNYFLGEGAYRVATPYHDANNGPPNFLFRNKGDGTFEEVTEPTGLGENNRRFSFACAWADYDRDGWPDLYVANDFGRNNLYRSGGRAADGRVSFRDVAAEAGVEDVAAGMSVAWLDYDNDGWEDLYVGNMWTPAGLRLTGQGEFHSGAPEEILELYRRHARGNALFRNRGDGTFEDTTREAEVELGRWAWSADAFDFDHDGWQDLYVANGMITNSDPQDLEGFFWRQVVAKSPLTDAPRTAFEDGWRAINRMIREEGTWNGRERNVFFRNDGHGKFQNLSGAVGLDILQDGRAFALLDLDRDGDLDLILKSRTGPQVRVFRNDATEGRNAVVVRLTGNQSNRDAIGARVTVQTEGLSQTRALLAGSGFLSQHTKELVFGLGDAARILRVEVEWPGGERQEFSGVPVNHRVEIREGRREFAARPFSPVEVPAAPAGPPGRSEAAPTLGTWLYQTFPAPDFTLADSAGRTHRLAEYRGRPLVLFFWSSTCAQSRSALDGLAEAARDIKAAGAAFVAVRVTDSAGRGGPGTLEAEGQFDFPIVVADEATLGIYNLLSKYLFDRNLGMRLPATFLIDSRGEIAKVYREVSAAESVVADLKHLDASPEIRLRRALPFPGKFLAAPPGRNYFQFGIYFSEKGYDVPAIAAFEETVRISPNFAKAHYNLGTLYLRSGDAARGRASLERAVEIDPDYAEAHNNLGALAAQSGQIERALQNFRRALQAQPDFPDALNNLGYLYLRLGRPEESESHFKRALALDPRHPETHNNLGMLFGQQGDYDRARTHFERALAERPDYAEAANNLALVYAQTGREEEALRLLSQALETHPDFEPPYLTLVRLHLNAGRHDEAAAVLERLLARKPAHREAKKLLEKLRRRSQ